MVVDCTCVHSHALTVLLWIFCVYLNVPATADVLRCYCNDASCVNTGYMCKSTIGRCYSLSSPDVATVARGCADFLPADLLGDDAACAPHAPSAVDAGGRLSCCREDLCNYEPKSSRNGNSAASDLADDDDGNFQMSPSSHHVTPNVDAGALRSHDVLFRAAVVAVPVTGLVALVLLVFLAARMLRNDFRMTTGSEQQRRRARDLTIGSAGGVPNSAIDDVRRQPRYEKMASAVGDADWLNCGEAVVTSRLRQWDDDDECVGLSDGAMYSLV